MNLAAEKKPHFHIPNYAVCPQVQWSTWNVLLSPSVVSRRCLMRLSALYSVLHQWRRGARSAQCSEADHQRALVFAPLFSEVVVGGLLPLQLDHNSTCCFKRDTWAHWVYTSLLGPEVFFFYVRRNVNRMCRAVMLMVLQKTKKKWCQYILSFWAAHVFFICHMNLP